MKKGFLFALLVVLLCFLSWLATCGIIYLITLCFGLKFKWIIATGIWLLVFLINLLLK